MEARRQARYDRIYKQLAELIAGRSPTLLAAMSTINAVLHAKMGHHSWTGFYFVHRPDELHVGPYQGAVACQILRGGGVCNEAVRRHVPVVVPDVEAFPGHIACDARSRSEIVIPLFRGNQVFGVFDADSSLLAAFSDEDVAPLQRILSLLKPFSHETSQV